MLGKTLKILIFAVAALVQCSATASVSSAASGDAKASNPLRFGVFPRRNANITFQMFKPLADYLSKSLGREVKLVTAKDFEQFSRAVQHREFDIVHFNQLHYIESAEHGDYKVIVMNEEFGSATISGAIAVRADSEIKKIDDLRGKRILFGGDKTAMIAYIVNTVHLRQAGLMDGDYEELFAKNPPNATMAMYRKRVDAAGTGNMAMNFPFLKKNGIDPSEIRLFITSPPLAHIPWAVNRHLDTELQARIQQLLIKLDQSDEGKALLDNAQLTGLRIAQDKDYDIYRKIIKDYSALTAEKSKSIAKESGQ